MDNLKAILSCFFKNAAPYAKLALNAKVALHEFRVVEFSQCGYLDVLPQFYVLQANPPSARDRKCDLGVVIQSATWDLSSRVH